MANSLNLKIWKRSILLFALVLLTSCAAPVEEDAPMTESDKIVASLSDLPSSVSDTSSVSASIRVRPAVTACSGSHCIYDGLRAHIGFAESAALMVKEIIPHIQNLLVLSNGTYATGTSTAYEVNKVVISTDAIYTKKVEIFWNSLSGSAVKGMEVRYSSNDNSAKGLIQIKPSVIDQTANITAAQIEFDGGYSLSGEKTLHIQVEGMTPSVAGDPVNIWIKYNQSGDSFTISGASYHSAIPTEMNGIITGYSLFSGSDFVYDYRGKGSISVNKATMDVAIAPTTMTDTTSLFSDFSLGDYFLEYGYNQVESYIDSPEHFSERSALISFFESNDGLATADGTLSIEEFEGFLNTYQDVPLDSSDDWVNEFRIYGSLVNSVYFDSNGFAGTWDGQKGLDANGNPATGKPVGFESYDASALEILIPANVKALEISEIASW